MSILSKIKPLESELASEFVDGTVKAFGSSDSKRNPGTKVHWIIASINGADYMVANPENKQVSKGDAIRVTAYENKQGEAWLQL